MAAPSYTFLLGEYVSFLKAMTASHRMDKLSKEFYQRRLEELKKIQLEDLPLHQAEVRCIDKETKALITKALY